MEMTKLFEENAIKVLENYKRSDTIDMKAAIACRSTFMSVSNFISADVPTNDADFTLEKLLCM